VNVGDEFADVKLDAYYNSKSGDTVFTASDNGNTSQSFVADRDGLVYLRVYPYEGGMLVSARYGVYAVAVTTTNIRPSGEETTLTQGRWTNVRNLADASKVGWYQINVTASTTYYIWVKEYWSNSVVVADGYADVLLDVNFGSKTGATILTGNDDGANSTPASFTPTLTGTVWLKVYPDPDWSTYGKYKVAYTTSSTRPSGE